MKKSLILVIYLALMLFTVAPILSVAAASIIAHACGARLDEGGQHSCVFLGFNVGPLLYQMFVAGWFMLITLPAGLFAIVVFTLSLLAAKLGRRS